MDDLERQIVQLDRPTPSPDLDERIGKLVMEAEWGSELKEVALRAAPFIILFVAVLTGYYLSTKTQSTLEPVALVDSKEQRSTDAKVLPVVSSELAELLMVDQMPARIWGTDRLAMRVAQR